MHSFVTLLASHAGEVCGGDAFDLGAMGGFAVAGITDQHAVLVEGVQVTLATVVASGQCAGD
jgi:hypothetical protein